MFQVLLMDEIIESKMFIKDLKNQIPWVQEFSNMLENFVLSFVFLGRIEKFKRERKENRRIFIGPEQKG